jgi:hypothetical protein
MHIEALEEFANLSCHSSRIWKLELGDQLTNRPHFVPHDFPDGLHPVGMHNDGSHNLKVTMSGLNFPVNDLAITDLDHKERLMWVCPRTVIEPHIVDDTILKIHSVAFRFLPVWSRWLVLKKISFHFPLLLMRVRDGIMPGRCGMPFNIFFTLALSDIFLPPHSVFTRSFPEIHSPFF